MSRKEEVEQLQNKLKVLETELQDIQKKFGYAEDSWIFISQECIDGLKYLIDNTPTYIIFNVNDKQFLDLIDVDKWDITYAVEQQFKYHYNDIWKKYKNRYNEENGFDDYHIPLIGDILGHFGEKDEKWGTERNKDLRYEAYLKYNYSDEIISDIRKKTEELLELSKWYAKIYETIDKTKEEIEKTKKRGFKEFSHSFYSSWETGITFLVIPYKKNNKKPLDTNTFNRLRKEAGLFNHDYIDAENEERFMGWATPRIDDAVDILREEKYFIDS